MRFKKLKSIIKPNSLLVKFIKIHRFALAIIQSEIYLVGFMMVCLLYL